MNGKESLNVRMHYSTVDSKGCNNATEWKGQMEKEYRWESTVGQVTWKIGQGRMDGQKGDRLNRKRDDC